MTTQNKHWLQLLIALLIFIPGCKKEKPIEEPPVVKPQATATTQKINTFLRDVMTDVYLWYDKMPELDIKYEFDSKAYFKKLLYTDDKWSFVTDDVTVLENSLQGVQKTYGYSLAFGSLVSPGGLPTGNYFALVEYVYPNTPAAKAGFARGDIIIYMNSGNITQDNYTNLLSGTSVTVTKGILTAQGLTVGTTLTMVAEDLNLDPVLLYKIIDIEGHKIGYLMYLQYIASYNTSSLYTALQSFKDNQITDMVLDLRYNPGGQVSAAQYLCSSLAPVSFVTNKSSLVTFRWNDKYQAYWTSTNNQAQLGVNFDAGVEVKLGLSKLHVLTGNNTASASELTICGLGPYMNITLVGDTTYGKYTATFVIKPADFYKLQSEYADFKNWGLMPVIMRYANSAGLTDFKNGFAPKYYVKDELMPASPLGDLTEPLLKKAVEDILGHAIASPKKARIPIDYVIVKRGFTKPDPLKGNLFIDSPLKPK
jgi:carboxyl-terminal processing protease